MPERVQLSAIALGSNLGDRELALRTAISRIGQIGRVHSASRFFDTEPVGFVDQPRFLNAALLLETDLDALPLLRELLAIERAMGRERANVPAKGPRIIDLDLLLYGNCVLATEELTLPHPAMHERIFVLEPLAEIASDWIHPVLGRSVAALLAEQRASA